MVSLKKLLITVKYYNTTTQLMEYRIALIFCESKILRIAVFDKKFRTYAVELLEASDGVKCQNCRWNNYFHEWHQIRENHENLGPQK